MILFLSCILHALAAGTSGIAIEGITPTPFFPKTEQGKPLRQRADLALDNPGAPVDASARITVGSEAAYTLDLGTIAPGKSTVPIFISDIAASTKLTVEVLSKNGLQPLAKKELTWQPQKKWTVYSCEFSHQDLGFGDYPHRLRTSIRHGNIVGPLQFCRETDAWPAEDQYRFNIETSEPITSFISFHGKDAARELAQRMREGRIALGRLHNTANTEELGHELMARLFYMSGRYAVDLLGAPASKTMQNDDVVGLTWPLATYAAEADVLYFMHGFNGCGGCEKPAEFEPVFYWKAPDSSQHVLEHASAYGEGSNIGLDDATRKLIASHTSSWQPYDVMFNQCGSDYLQSSRTFVDRIHAWNAKWAYPRLLCATMDMFFDAVSKEIKPSIIKTFALDSNNQWSDQDYAAACASGQARKLTESLPATETMASVAQAIAGGGDQWINTFQGYHRLLQYWEHTNAKDVARGNMAWYETELEENREMVAEAGGYQQQVFSGASQRLADAISRTAERNLIVFNPLPYQRTDIVQADIPADLIPVDPVTGKKPHVQRLPDGRTVFVAEDIPATGYKVYELVAGQRDAGATAQPELESKFYRIEYNHLTGALTSLYDKTLGIDLIETNAPHAFNEYLYEYRTHTTGLNFDSVWSRMAKADSIKVVRGPVADVLTVTGKAEGVRALKQTVVLYHDLPRLDFGIWMDKAPAAGKVQQNHEAVFVALPFDVPNFRIHHELPGAVIEPYRQQFQGSATDHYAIRSFTDFSNGKFGVTVSPIEGSLVCYGEPTSSPMVVGREGKFKRDQTYPEKSRLYLYLLNNMFDVNLAFDQQGPVSFNWALRSHAGDWKTGGADRFGRSVQQPLLAWRADGKNNGTLPASGSFMGVDVANVMCSVIKPAEANGRGFIIRLNETTGTSTTATVTLPMLNLESARATSLVENDRPEEYPITGHSFKITMPEFGVKTIRVTCAGDSIAISDLSAKAVADMQVDLNWTSEGKNVDHFNIYRDTHAECAPTQLNFIGQSATGSFTDLPRVNLGGWLRSCLDPKTTYYYRIVPVDRANNPGAPSAIATVTTPDSTQGNLPPVAVEGLHAILVSPISKDNFVNLLFRTACEPDVEQYEIHRSAQPDFSAGTNTLVGMVKSDDVPPRSGGYGEQRTPYKTREYDHATFADKSVEPSTTYYYKVRAVDTAAQKGAFSDEVSIRTRDSTSKDAFRTAAQSVYSSEFEADNAVDGDSAPQNAWISKQYGGGTKENPRDIWWQIEFVKKPLTIKGVKITGDHRDVIPHQKNLQVQLRDGGTWKTVGEIKDATTKDVTITFAQPVIIGTLRILVPAADLPKSERADVDGIVRICELAFILPDGTEKGVD